MDDEWVSIKIDKHDPKVETFAKGVLGIDMSADRKTLLVGMRGENAPRFALVPAGPKMPKEMDGKQVHWRDVIGATPSAVYLPAIFTI